MSAPMTLILKKKPRLRIEMSPLSPHLIVGKSIADIGSIKLVAGKRTYRTDELFNISGTDGHQLVIKKSCDKLDFVGCDMESGSIEINGDVGAYLGKGMNGGNIYVKGNIGIFAACEMKKGTIRIDGNAGDFLGSALPGNKKGMQGGLVLIHGDVGARLGDIMRRGTILVEGNAGDYCGSRMIAGTIAIMGKTGNHIGYGMNRGTLLLWHKPKLSPTFADCGAHTLSSFLPLLFRSFRRLDSKFADLDREFHRITRYVGDLSSLGKGEILVKRQ